MAVNAMPADEFRTELRDSLTAFYENILKKTGAGGRPMANISEPGVLNLSNFFLNLSKLWGVLNLPKFCLNFF